MSRKSRFLKYLIAFLLGAVTDEFGFAAYELLRNYEIVRRNDPVQQIVPPAAPETQESLWILPRPPQDLKII